MPGSRESVFPKVFAILCVLSPASAAWAAQGDPIHGVDIKLGITDGAVIETTSISAFRGGAVFIEHPHNGGLSTGQRVHRDASSGQASGRRTYRPGRPVFGNITFERAQGKSSVWRDQASGQATGKRQHKPISYTMTLGERGAKGGELRSVTWFECFLTGYELITSTGPGGERILVEQITFEPGGAEFTTQNRGGVPADTLGVDLDGDGTPDLAATRQLLTRDPTLGFPDGSPLDPSLDVRWIVDTQGPTIGFFKVLNGIISPDQPRPGKGGIIGPEINAVVTEGGKLVDEYRGMRLCGFEPPQFGEEVTGETAPSNGGVFVCGKTQHL